jgi:hypothetical protein
MLKKESSNLFILSVTCIFFTIALLSIFLYSTDKLIADVSDITKSAYTPEQKTYDNVHFKIVSNQTGIQHNTKRSAAQKLHPSTHDKNHFTKSAPIVSYDVEQKPHPFFSTVRETVTFIPKVVAVSPLLTVGKLGSVFLLKMAVHSVKILSTEQSE